MRKWMPALLVLLALLLPYTAHAQTSQRFSSLEVDLWPEYDSPMMLVIYRIVLSSNVSLPVELTVRIPATAGKPSAVAAKQIDGTLINVTYVQQQVGDWSTLKFTATMPEIQIEYYDPGLTKQGTARHFTFNLPGDYEVDALTIQVQQPFDATNLRIAPGLGLGSVGKDGLSYYEAQLGATKAGQALKLVIDYEKPTDAVSIEKLPVKPSAPISDNTTFFASISKYLPWVLGGVGLFLVLVAVGVLVYWQVSRRDDETDIDIPRRRSRSRRKETEALAEVAESEFEMPVPGEDGAYCHACGKRASSGDRFCRSCGTRLRQE